MIRKKCIAELKTARSPQEQVVARAVTTFRGIEAELASLKAGVSLGAKLDSLPRTDAMLNVLRSTGRTLTPMEIVSLLHAAGRDDERGSSPPPLGTW